ncbi:MAG: hypothetical protein LBI38_06915 [Oscillospiraceae bacterium]|jgi:hypothetical protein|nr:hypothetical protein [Oscillospiraceae bacterium]
MFEYLFGRYLINTGKITPEKLSGLIDCSNAESLIRENARGEEGFYAEIERLDAVLNSKLSELIAEYDARAGAVNPKEGRSGSYAPNYLFFKRLIREKVIPADRLDGELREFEKHYSLGEDGVSRVFGDDTEMVFASFIDSRDYFANQYMAILLKHILRFVGAGIRFSPGSGVFSYSAERMAVQKVVAGDERYFIGICGDKPTLQKLNDSLARDFAAGGYDGRYDSLRTFLNCVSCIFQSVIEKEKSIYLLDSPFVYKFSTVSANESCFLLPVTVGDTRLDLLIGFGIKPNFATISHNI